MALIEAELPNLRRYARAVTGCRESGDALADRAAERAAPESSRSALRVSLYTSLDRFLADPSNTHGATIASPAHRALLLTELEDFSDAEAAAITRLTQSDFATSVDAARTEALSAGPAEIFIIEDEPLIAAHISELARQMGHIVLGTAATAQAARTACREHPPGLLLSDIILGEEATGADVAREISAANDIPVVYVTAFPQTLLKGKTGEPTYLVKKPFKSAAVKAMIGQAILRQKLRKAS